MESLQNSNENVDKKCITRPRNQSTK